MLEQWLGAGAVPRRIRRYLAKHAYGNTGRTTCGTRSRRRPASPSADDGRLDLPGGLSGDLRRSRRVASIRSTDTSVQPGRRHDVAGAADGAAGGRRRRAPRPDPVEADGAELDCSRPTPWCRERAGSASFVRVFYDDELRSRIVGSAMDVLSPIERYSLVDDAWAAVVAGQAPAGSFLDLVAGFDARDRPARVAGDPRRARVARPVRRRRAARAPAGVRAGPRAAGARAARLGPRGGRDRCARAPRPARAVARDPRRGPGDDGQCRELELGDDGDPQLLQAAVEAVAAEGEGGPRPVLGAESAAAAGGGAVPVRHVEVPRRGRDRARPRVEHVRRGPHPGRPPPRPATTNRHHGPRVWRFIAERWDQMQERFASSNIIGLVSGIRTSRIRPSSRRSTRSSGTTTSRRTT